MNEVAADLSFRGLSKISSFETWNGVRQKSIGGIGNHSWEEITNDTEDYVEVRFRGELFGQQLGGPWAIQSEKQFFLERLQEQLGFVTPCVMRSGETVKFMLPVSTEYEVCFVWMFQRDLKPPGQKHSEWYEHERRKFFPCITCTARTSPAEEYKAGKISAAAVIGENPVVRLRASPKQKSTHMLCAGGHISTPPPPHGTQSRVHHSRTVSFLELVSAHLEVQKLETGVFALASCILLWIGLKKFQRVQKVKKGLNEGFLHM
eukprot:gnl/MRDRNA2_/MRDRNA2_59306_c0_seq2.p1 gnl/MRDRNA2_/MRDRNA2_59306_c0~~gnl/MRDRNA2_/MRDRNA2_59306_c0_seq2.p1  ORF type:complete len:262 (+),score=36.11 gnl/MRDRNA2_/MRDRNA2_59306_c0_seq2:193-978(+)